MNNKQLNYEVKSLLAQKSNLSITKGDISGASIEIRNTKTNEDLGSFVYYDRETQRDQDFETLMKTING